MIINIGSKNPAKVEAVRDVLEEYDFLKPFGINSFDVSSEISEQPIGLDLIVFGSRNRAKNSFSNCDYSFGLESGLLRVPYSDSFLDICSCSIYDGKNFYFGFSEAFEIPRNILKIILEENLDLSQATRKAGLTNSEKIGNEKGIINILSGGRFVRGDQIKTALRMALIGLENPNFYR
jgi:inosine/xanthosine triphosphatase